MLYVKQNYSTERIAGTVEHHNHDYILNRKGGDLHTISFNWTGSKLQIYIDDILMRTI